LVNAVKHQWSNMGQLQRQEGSGWRERHGAVGLRESRC
jgi:hypothetical protein